MVSGQMNIINCRDTKCTLVQKCVININVIHSSLRRHILLSLIGILHKPEQPATNDGIVQRVLNSTCVQSTPRKAQACPSTAASRRTLALLQDLCHSPPTHAVPRFQQSNLLLAELSPFLFGLEDAEVGRPPAAACGRERVVAGLRAEAEGQDLVEGRGGGRGGGGTVKGGCGGGARGRWRARGPRQ